MKPNKDLFLKILRWVEARPDRRHGRPEIEGHSREEVGYHVKLLHDKGLVEAMDMTTYGNSFDWLPFNLTLAGHEFLDNYRRDTWPYRVLKLAGRHADWFRDVAKAVVVAVVIAYVLTALGLAP